MPEITSIDILANRIIGIAEDAAAYCPACGCDWDSDTDPHEEGCEYVQWADADGHKQRGIR